jgi:polyribonucleotide nucleotidyltransferase
MGLLHISELEHARTNKVEDVVSVGERMEVMVVGKDQRGNIKLSVKALLPTPRPASNSSRSS